MFKKMTSEQEFVDFSSKLEKQIRGFQQQIREARSRDDASVRIWNMFHGTVNTLFVAPRQEAPMRAAWHPGGHIIALHVPSGLKLLWRTMCALPRAAVSKANGNSSSVQLDPLGLDAGTTRENFAHGVFGHDFKLVPAGAVSLSSIGALVWSPSGALLAVGTDRCTLVFGLIGTGATGGRRFSQTRDAGPAARWPRIR